MAMAAFAAPAMAQNMASAGTGGVDILGNGIFETGGSAFHVPGNSHTNFDTIDVGNDWSQAIGAGAVGIGPFAQNYGPVKAENNLKIKKNQDSGDCQCCQAIDSNSPCQDCCVRYNVEQIRVGSRSANAIGAFAGGIVPFGQHFGGVTATNNQEIVTNQQ